MKTVIEMAREAGFAEGDAMFRVAFVANENNLKHFTELVRADERNRTWVGLTDVEWMNIVNKDQAWFGHQPDEVAHEVAKLVEAKLKEKNT